MSADSVCAIHQPNFLPRLSTVAKIYAADTWVVLDTVQYNGRDYQNRCRLAELDNPEKWRWLSLPARRPRGRVSLISEVAVLEPARSRHRIAQILHQTYRRSPYWPLVLRELEPVLDLVTRNGQLSCVAEESTLALLRLPPGSTGPSDSSTSPGPLARRCTCAAPADGDTSMSSHSVAVTWPYAGTKHRRIRSPALVHGRVGVIAVLFGHSWKMVRPS